MRFLKSHGSELYRCAEASVTLVHANPGTPSLCGKSIHGTLRYGDKMYMFGLAVPPGDIDENLRLIPLDSGVAQHAFNFLVELSSFSTETASATVE
jgi:hypothetical protein